MQIWSTFGLYVRIVSISAFNYLREANFSQVTLIKTKHVNALKGHGVANKILAKKAINQQSAACYSRIPPKSLILKTPLEDGVIP